MKKPGRRKKSYKGVVAGENRLVELSKKKSLTETEQMEVLEHGLAQGISNLHHIINDPSMIKLHMDIEGGEK